MSVTILKSDWLIFNWIGSRTATTKKKQIIKRRAQKNASMSRIPLVRDVAKSFRVKTRGITRINGLSDDENSSTRCDWMVHWLAGTVWAGEERADKGVGLFCRENYIYTIYPKLRSIMLNFSNRILWGKVLERV